MKKIDIYGKCPICGVSWLGDSIFDTLRVQEWTKDLTDDELWLKIKEDYNEPYSWSNIIYIELHGFSGFYRCPYCNTLFSKNGDTIGTKINVGGD